MAETAYQDKILHDRYAQIKPDGTKETTLNEIFTRISQHASRGNALLQELFFNLLINRYLIPAGRILSNVGGTGNNMVGNCFYVPILEDSLDGIMKRQADTVKIFAKGGGVGSNFSILRPKNAPVQGAPDGTSGPCSFIDATEGYSKTIKQGGSRRAANLIAMNCDHPDIFEFITAKTDHKRWESSNVSVGFTDDFMKAVKKNEDWNLKFNGKVFQTVKAQAIWNEFCRCAWQSAEPGALFLDTINRKYPLNYLYKIDGTNPCVSGDTHILTLSGYKKAEDIQTGEMIQTKWGFESVASIEKHKQFPVKKIKLSDGGCIRVTQGHIFYGIRKGKESKKLEEIRVDTLKIGDYIAVSPNKESDSHLHVDETKKRDYQLGLLSGILLGDGCFTESQVDIKDSMKICGNIDHMEYLNNIKKLLNDLGYDFNKLNISSDESKSVTLPIKHASDILTTLNLSPSFSFDKAINTNGGNKEFAWGILAGLVATDGNINLKSNHPIIRIDTTSHHLAEDIRRIGLALGMHPRITQGKLTDVSGCINGRTIQRHHVKLTVHFSGSSLQTLQKGLRSRGLDVFYPEKCGRLKELDTWLMTGNTEKAQVVSIEDGGFADVYDFFCAESDTFIAEGYLQRGCGEQPLPPYGMCLLGSMILPTFVKDGKFQWDEFRIAVDTSVRFLDSLIDTSTFPIPEVRDMTLRTRPIGLGMTGLADALFLMELPYGDYPQTLKFVDQLGKFMYDAAKESSEKLAEELGAFPDYDPEKAKFPARRNATLLSYAPTGTISGLVGCSYGIEPHFAPLVTRNEDLGRDVVSNPIIDAYMEEHGLTTLPSWARFVGGVEAEHQLTLNDHLTVLKVLAKHCDSGISKTVNLPKDATQEDVAKVFMYCWENGIKGVTVYRDGCRDDQPVTFQSKDTQTEEDDEMEDEFDDDFEDNDSEDAVELVDYRFTPEPRPRALSGTTYKFKPNMEQPSMYMTINNLEERPIEIFFHTQDAVHQELLGGLSRSLTMNLRANLDVMDLMDEYKKYESHSGGGWYKLHSGKSVCFKSILHAIGVIYGEHVRRLEAEIESEADILIPSTHPEEPPITATPIKGAKCPTCGEYSVRMAEGCKVCELCGYSACG